MPVCNTCHTVKEGKEFHTRGKNWKQSDCKECNNFLTRCRYKAAKELVFLALGNQCCHCGFSDKRALQIDHISGGGTQARKYNKQTSITYLKYVANHSELFQILCVNCNWIKRSVNKEGNKWNLSELPLLKQMEAVKIASSFAAKNMTGFIKEDRLLQMAAKNVG